MKKLILLFALLCASVYAWGQGATVLFPALQGPNGTSVPFAHLTFCTTPATFDNLGNCTNTATVYQNITLTTPYSSAITTDGVGNFPPNAVTSTAIWFSPAQNYCYTATGGNLAVGPVFTCTPFSVSVINGSSPTFANTTITGNLTATAGQNTLSAYNINGVYVVDGNKYTTIDSAIAAVPSFSITSCTESSTTVTCLAPSTTGMIVGAQWWIQGVSVLLYNGSFVITQVTPNTSFQYVNCFGTDGTQTCNSGLSAGSGGTASATGIIEIPWNYLGAESTQCALVDGYTQFKGTPNLNVIDRRGGSGCGYNIAYNSGQQGARPTRLSLWQYINNLAQNTASAAVFTSDFTGALSNSGTMASGTFETDITGAITAGTSTVISGEAYTAIRSTGGTLPLVFGFTGGCAMDRIGSTTNVTTCGTMHGGSVGTPAGSGTFTNIYGVWGEGQNVATARNYGGFFGRGTGGTSNGNILVDYSSGASQGNIDFVNPAGTPCRGIWMDSSTNINIDMCNTGGGGSINLNQNGGSQRVKIINSGIVPATAGGEDLGSAALPWGHLVLGTAATNNFTFTPAATAAARTVNIPDPLATTNLGLNLNATNGFYQSKRGVAGCTTGGAAGNSCGTDITVTWGTAFADANYSVTCTGSTPTNVPSGPFVVSGTKLAATVHINYFAITAAAASYATIDCIAVHD